MVAGSCFLKRACDGAISIGPQPGNFIFLFLILHNAHGALCKL
jgi:hypothetical protein